MSSSQEASPGVDVSCEFRDRPLAFARLLWPHVSFYREQQKVLESVVANDETFVPAGNMLGKDFVSGFVALWFFLTRSPVRVVTTSVKDDHLRVLWGEIGRFVQESRFPLAVKDGGPLILNHRDIRKMVLRHPGPDFDVKNMGHAPGMERVRCEISYLRGMVSERGEGMAGHHATHTLCIIDEASGVDDLVYTQQATWARKLLAIGNCNPTQNFFYKGIKGGDLSGARR